jgi:hypothetical protein
MAGQTKRKLGRILNLGSWAGEKKAKLSPQAEEDVGKDSKENVHLKFIY